MRLRAAPFVVLAGLVGCNTLFSPLPHEVVLAAAEPVFDLGHPMADYDRAEVAGSANGSMFGGGSHDRYVDVDVHGRPKHGEKTQPFLWRAWRDLPPKGTTRIVLRGWAHGLGVGAARATPGTSSCHRKKARITIVRICDLRGRLA